MVTSTATARDAAGSIRWDAARVAEVKRAIHDLQLADRNAERQLTRLHTGSTLAGQLRWQRQRLAERVQELRAELLRAGW